MRGRPPSGSLGHLGEFGFIERVRRRLGPARAPLLHGVGDDAAAVRLGPDRALVLTVDLLIEGIHFDLATGAPREIGYKAAIANFSDLAAMGAAPRYVLVALAAPPSTPVARLDGLYAGLLEACRRYRVALIGGDTSASPRHLFLSVTAAGLGRPDRLLTRAGARAGDHLYVTGTLGDAAAGLHLLEGGLSRRLAAGRGPLRTHPHARFLLRRHFRATARVRESQLLVRHRLASAAIDLSDGLSGDLRHLCERSRVGAEIEAASLPVSPACRWYAEQAGLDPLQLALQGGEDYELLVAVRPRRRAQLERLARKARLRLTRIGTVTARRAGLTLKPPSGPWRRLAPTSYQHFTPGRAR